ncbi:MAG: ABC transporter permease [Rhizobiaceae bacterium]
MTASAAISGSRLRLPATIGVWPLLLALAVLLFLPAAAIIANSFTEPQNVGFSNFSRILSDPTFRLEVRLQHRPRRRCGYPFFTGLIGYFYAYAIYRSGPAGRSFLMTCALLPLWTSLLVRSFAWTVILRDTGIVNWLLMWVGIVDEPIGMLRTSFAVTVGMIQILLPFTILPIFASMTKFDTTLLLAARSLGASPRRSFWLVFFPATQVGLVAGLMLVFVLSLGYYITPVLLGGPRDQPVAVLIDAQVTTQLDWGAAGAMSAIVTAAVLLMLAAGWRAINKIFLV